MSSSDSDVLVFMTSDWPFRWGTAMIGVFYFLHLLYFCNLIQADTHFPSLCIIIYPDCVLVSVLTELASMQTLSLNSGMFYFFNNSPAWISLHLHCQIWCYHAIHVFSMCSQIWTNSWIMHMYMVFSLWIARAIWSVQHPHPSPSPIHHPICSIVASVTGSDVLRWCLFACYIWLGMEICLIIISCIILWTDIPVLKFHSLPAERYQAVFMDSPFISDVICHLILFYSSIKPWPLPQTLASIWIAWHQSSVFWIITTLNSHLQLEMPLNVDPGILGELSQKHAGPFAWAGEQG